MQMHKAPEEVQVIGHAKANETLAEGWKLLTVVPGGPQGSSPSTSVIYVLGKHKPVTESSIS